MKILLTNDDGYNAPGIIELDRVLTAAGHEVWVCAPASQRSTCSHALTLHKDLRIIKVSRRRYHCEGYPADCVLFALSGAIPCPKPDVVVSGINNGFNLSTDLIYSGTVGAAQEAVVRGYKAIAVSTSGAYTDAAEFVAKHVERLTEICPEGCYININVPVNSQLRYKPSVLGNTHYHDTLKGGGEIFKITGEEAPSMDKPYDSNVDYARVTDQSTVALSCVRILPSIDEEGQALLSDLDG